MRKTFYKMNGECKMSCVKLVLWWIVSQKGTNTLIFYVFKHGVECSAESGAK